MRLSLWLTGLVALVVTAIALGAAWALLNPAGPPLEAASFSHAALSPNADGRDDAAVIRYRLRRPATVSIYFRDAAGARYDFRRDKARPSGESEVLFSGIVDPFTRPGDTIPGALLARVLPDGDYTWVVAARDAAGGTNQITGSLTIRDADTALPLLNNLTASPSVFTPNRDGLDDRVTINVDLSKDVGENGLRLSLRRADGSGVAVPLAESPVSRKKPGEAGLHTFDYDGGIDQGQSPPPDGEYIVQAEAEDRLGQRTVVSTTLSLRLGGLPRAEIYLGEVRFSSESVVLGETLYFTLTVNNYGAAPIRTTGPAPGFVYDSMAVNYNTLGQYVQAGVFRVGLMCETCISDYPWRWAIGRPEDLTMIPDSSGRPQYYLEPGGRSVVTGGVVLDQIVSARNPQYFYAGLIHEEVEIAAINNRVDPAFILIGQP